MFNSNITFGDEPRVPHPVAQAREVLRAELVEIVNEELLAEILAALEDE